MGRTCGGASEIELTPTGVKLNGSRRVLLDDAVVLGLDAPPPAQQVDARPLRPVLWFEDKRLAGRVVPHVRREQRLERTPC